MHMITTSGCVSTISKHHVKHILYLYKYKYNRLDHSNNQ